MAFNRADQVGNAVTRPRRRITEGDLLVFDEKDYMYGLGELTIRVADLFQTKDPEWAALDGTEVLWNGQDGIRRPVLVRISALPEALEKGDAKKREQAADALGNG